MLARDQNKSEEKLYSEPYSHLGNIQSESRESSRFLQVEKSKLAPSRRKQNRSAFRENKKVKDSPVEEKKDCVNSCHDNGQQKIVSRELDVPQEVNPPTLEDAELEDANISLRRKISLGDYAMPPDRMTEMPGSIPRINSTEYSEPYETSKMIQALRNEERAEQLRRSSPAKLDNSDIYSLAKNVEKRPSIQRSVSELKNQKYAASYEEPWDSQWKIKEFTDICDKAEEVSSRRPSEGSPSHHSKNKMANVYEDAWDTANKQRELEMKMQDAHRRRNSESVCTKFDYEEPAGQRKFSLGQADLKSAKKKWTPALSPPSIKDSKEPVYTSNYDCPWDNMQLEERLSRAGGLSPNSPSKSKRSSNSSDSSPGPPDFSPPPPPVQQAYEEAWDLRPQAKVLDSPPKHRLTSPSHSTDGESISEQVDAKLPLDLQKFYHGGISRKQAEELLIVYKTGSYLVRRSETQKNVFSLSLKGVGGIPMHLRIGLEHGEYILGENSQPFPTVPELIAYYTKHELPIQNANHIKLQFPIPRNQGMF